jgi:putative transposase
LATRGIRIEFVKECLSFTDGDSPMANLLLSVMGAFAEFERALIGERQREGIALAKQRGAYRGCKKALKANGDPDKVAMDKSGANRAALDAINADRDVPILVRQVKYLNNIVEQDHRAIKRMTRPMLNFKSFRSAGSVLVGIELMHMIRKGQFAMDGAEAMSIADQFSALAGMVRPV